MVSCFIELGGTGTSNWVGQASVRTMETSTLGGGDVLVLGRIKGEVDLDHSTVNRWVFKYAPEVEKKFRKLKRPVAYS